MSDDSHLLALRTERFLIDSRQAEERHAEAMRPSTLYRPRLSIDGDQWCALHGENLQDGVAGFGTSPEAAYAAFDRAWRGPLPGRI